jgi:REP element-mobilizing transposase RayT
MARPYRLQGEGLLYHITSRGDDRKKVFINETDYKKFLGYLRTAQEKFQFYLYAYCLMGNHYHLLFETTQSNLSRIMHSLNTAYTVYYNVKRKRSGHLFQGRYKSILVDKDNYFLELTRYIHLNPVRAGIVDRPEQYQWSSYREYLEKSEGSLIDKAELSRYLKLSSDQYREFVLGALGKSIDPFADVYGGFILGKAAFIKDTLALLKEKVEGGDYAYKKKIEGVEPGRITREVAFYYKQDLEALRKARKKPLLAKKIAVYLLKRWTSLTNKEIGREFGIGYSGVSWITQDVERLIREKKKIKDDTEAIISHLKV